MKTKLFASILCLSFLFSNAQVKEFWGMTTEGGIGLGAIFKTDSAGNNPQLMHSFGKNPGANPLYTRLCEASNGKLYGLTRFGGAANAGVLFAYDTLTGNYETKFQFSALNGSEPGGSLVEAPNGKLFGMTTEGGTAGMGVLFEFDPLTDVYTKKIDFTGAANGSAPFGSLMECSNGKYYGMTSIGGASNQGVLFEYDIAGNILTKRFDFDGFSGSGPRGDLMEAINGKLYGMTTGGGIFGNGVIFEYDTAQSVLTKVNDFYSVSGSNPLGSLTLASNGKLYGLAFYGGTSGTGVLFEFDYTTLSYNVKVNFTGPNGNGPVGTLLMSNGKMYGMTSSGNSGIGKIFSYIPGNASVNQVYSFTNSAFGSQPSGSLMLSNNGKMYGLTYLGGISDNGVLFEFNPSNNSYLKKVDLLDNIDGSMPYGSLLKASNGLLYGLTKEGGASNYGVLFEFDPYSNLFTKRIDFDLAKGVWPYGTLTEASDGLLYGMTYGAGGGNGNLFAYNTFSHTQINKHSFIYPYGTYPYGSLIEANGKLWGMTSAGGNVSGNEGVIFEYDISLNSYVEKANFTYYPNGPGGEPLGTLLAANNGKLYGLTSRFGLNYEGTLFEFDTISNGLSRKVNFNSSLGRNPYGDLIEATNGKLYGFGSNSGTGIGARGTIIEYDILNDTCIRKFTFTFADSLNGNYPYGSFLNASNGKLYGMTLLGGSNNMGVLFEYNPGDTIITKKFDFDGSNGSKPYYGHLIEATFCANVSVTQNLAVFTAGATNATYQWIDCTTMLPIPGETNQSFTATVNGSYAVIVIQNGCTDTSNCYTINNVGINAPASPDDFMISPVLSDGKILLTYPPIKNKNARLEVIDSKGISVYSTGLQSENSRITLDLSFLSNGAYSCSITGNDYFSSKRFVIIHK